MTGLLCNSSTLSETRLALCRSRLGSSESNAKNVSTCFEINTTCNSCQICDSIIHVVFPHWCCILLYLAASRYTTQFVGSLLQVIVDKTARKQHNVSGTHFSQILDLSNISTVTTDRVPSIHTSGSQSSQSTESENSLGKSLPVSNTTEGQAALDSLPVVQHREAVSSAAAHQNAFFEHSAHGQSHEEQSSKLGTDQPHASKSLQPDGILNNVTSNSKPRPVVKPQPADRDDLIIVMPSSIDRMPIVSASRGWRQGVRTYISFEDEVDLKSASSIFRVCINTFQAILQPTQLNLPLAACCTLIVQLSLPCRLCSLDTALTPFMAASTSLTSLCQGHGTHA